MNSLELYEYGVTRGDAEKGHKRRDLLRYIFMAFSSWRGRFKAATGKFPKLVKRDYTHQQHIHLT